MKIVRWIFLFAGILGLLPVIHVTLNLLLSKEELLPELSSMGTFFLCFSTSVCVLADIILFHIKRPSTISPHDDPRVLCRSQRTLQFGLVVFLWVQTMDVPYRSFAFFCGPLPDCFLDDEARNQFEHSLTHHHRR